MNKKEFDPNEEFAMREKSCKDGRFIEAFLPVKRHPRYKKRVAELYAHYQVFPAGTRIQKGFPKLGLCVVFIHWNGILHGKFLPLTSAERQEYYRKLIEN